MDKIFEKLDYYSTTLFSVLIIYFILLYIFFLLFVEIVRTYYCMLGVVIISLCHVLPLY